METQFVKNVTTSLKKKHTEDGPNVITINMLSDNFGGVKTRTLIGVGVDTSPAKLAATFLEFVTIEGDSYT